MKTTLCKSNKFFTMLLLMSMILVSCNSCTKDDEGIDPGDPGNPGGDATFESVVAKGGTFETVPQSRTDETVSEGDEYPEDYTNGTGDDAEKTRYNCKERVVSVLDGTGDFQTLGSAGSVIYPGALLQGKTINNVTPQGIPLKRAGGSISYNINDGNPEAAQDLDEMSESQVRQAMNDIIAGSTKVVPANFDLVYENVYSEEQVALQMGLSFEGYGAKVEGKLSFSKEETYNRILVKLNQSYYDVSYDFPTSYDDIFDPTVTPEDLDKHIQADNPATYIKSVTYGRIFYMLIESTSSLETMDAQISASYKSFDKEIEGELDTQSMEKMENLKVKVIAYGGDSQNTFSGLGETSIEALSEMLANSTDIRTGLPLSYTIHSLEDASLPVGTNISTEMSIVECTLKGVLPPVGFNGLVDLFDDGIGAATQLYGRYIALYNKAGDTYAIFNFATNVVSEKYNINDANGPMGATSFSKVGAALRAFLTKIYVFNEDGTQYEIIDYDNNQSGMPTSPFGNYIQENGSNKRYVTDDVFTGNQVAGTPALFLTNLDCATYPFVSKGIQAAARRSIGDANISTTAFNGETTRTRTYFYSLDSNGTLYSRLDFHNPGPSNNLTGSENIRCWADAREVSNINDFRLSTIEAACKVELNDTDYILYFSPDGLLSRQDLDGDIQEGPWAIN